MKKFIISFSLILSLVGMISVAHAADQGAGAIVHGKTVPTIIRMVPDKDTYKPIYMVAIRDTAEALGYSVQWDNLNQVVTVTSAGGSETSKTIGSVILERKVRPSVAWAVYQDHIDIASEGAEYTYTFPAGDLGPERYSGKTFLSIDVIKQIFGLKELK